MKRLVVVIPMVATLALGSAVPARAGASTDAALALGAFAVLNQLVRGETILHNIVGSPSVAPTPVVVHQPPPVVYAPPPVVVYPRPVYYVYQAPVVIHEYPAVPPGHAKHGKKHAWKRSSWHH